MKTLPHLKIAPALVQSFALLPGDPARVDSIGQKMDDFKILGQNREFRIGNGLYRGRKITVCSTGIGCPSTAIAVEELISSGAKVLIRVGTCGGAWRADIPLGSLVIPTAAVRDEGTTREYIPEPFPAVADFQVVEALIKSAKKLRLPYFCGINRTHDAFYGSQNAITKWGEYLADKRWQGKDTPILSSDMETAALFVIATLYGVRAGAVLAVNARPEPLQDRIRGKRQKVATESDKGQRRTATERAIETALEGVVNFAEKEHSADPL